MTFPSSPSPPTWRCATGNLFSRLGSAGARGKKGGSPVDDDRRPTERLLLPSAQAKGMMPMWLALEIQNEPGGGERKERHRGEKER